MLTVLGCVNIVTARLVPTFLGYVNIATAWHILTVLGCVNVQLASAFQSRHFQQTSRDVQSRLADEVCGCLRLPCRDCPIREAENNSD